jgi:predicted MFS family arabinose efflux permease
MGVVESMAAFCLAVGFSLGGAVAAIFNPRATFFMAGGVALAASFAFARLAVRTRRPRLQHANVSASGPAS